MKSIWSDAAAIIFDFDGVILESVDVKTDAFRELFRAYPEHQEAIVAYHENHLGVSRYHKFAWIYQELLGMMLSPSEEKRLGQQFSELVLGKLLECPMVPGTIELLEELKRLRIPTFVASGTPQEELEWLIERRDLGHYFEEVWGSPTEKPEIINHLIARYEFDRDRVYLIGDGLSDYMAARETSIRFIGRKTPFSTLCWDTYSVPWVDDFRGLETLERR